MCSGLESKIAWIASSRSPSIPKSADPAGGALEHPLAHRLAVGVVVVDRAAPRRPVRLREVRAKRLERGHARRADVVVDDVEDHRQPSLVGSGDEGRQSVGSAIGRLGCGEVDPVVAPAAGTREFGDRHDLDRGDPERGELGQVGDRAGKCALRAERPDVQLVDHEVMERRRRERRRRGIGDPHPRRAAEPVRLPPGCGIRERRAAVEHERVVVTLRRRHVGDEHAEAGGRHRYIAAAEA